MNINLKLLNTFMLVAEFSSFRRAAEESNRSQSAVSMQIRQLEAQLGVPLFHRTTRHVQLTREGDMLLAAARKALVELQSGLRKIKETVDIQRGLLSFACVPTIAASRLPDILSAFQARMPNITAHVMELAPTEMLEAIRQQDVDFGIGPRVPNSAEFHFAPLMLDEIWALIPPNLGRFGSNGIGFAELSQLPLLMLAGSSSINTMLADMRHTHGMPLNIRHEVSQVQTQIAMAYAGLGVAIVPKLALGNLGESDIQAVPIVDPPMVREVCVITLRGQALPPVAAHFAAMLQRLLPENPEPTSADKGRSKPDLSLVIKNG